MNQINIIEKTKRFVQENMKNDYTGHDWWHVQRVWKTAIFIAERESADLFIVELSALLHDIDDWKFNNCDENDDAFIAEKWLTSLSVDKFIIQSVCEIIQSVSFKGANVDSKPKTLEGLVTQDADRLDAIGAIGIARTFAFGGAFSQPIHNPMIPIIYHNTFEQYKKKKSTSVNHFYEKLLLLKDKMNTKTGKKLAEKKHLLMEKFLKQFHQEWENCF